MTNGNRKEVDIFTDLSELCSSPGYVYAIAYLCFRDNTIKYTDTVTTDEMPQKYSMDRLVRNESSLKSVKISTSLRFPFVISLYSGIYFFTSFPSSCLGMHTTKQQPQLHQKP
jgi:hypothetical protein